jgi:eukaryotic-like serine/threonine-protein kinase
MPDDPRGSGDDPTLTPSQAIGVSATSATVADARPTAARGALPERYQLGKQLGAGGMGEVLLASDRQIERDVAIKRMRMEPTPGAVARFIREAKIQGRLDHPAIVPVHELATDAEGRPFFVMKRLTGTTLAEVIGRGTHSRQKLLRAFADVCLAIEFAHSRSIIHRDLKPANIMLGDYGEVYVLDWGVARMLDEHDTREGERAAATSPDADTRDGATEVGAILGTPGYISPELLRGERLDTRADVYALGCILFEILAGEPLLPRGREALEAALGAINARPSARAPDVPPELDAICVAATASDRAQRPSARELAQSIERFLDGDRDLALRKTLAAAHVATGTDALASGDDAATRSTAMREAGRALALDPRNQEAAALIGRLMLEPPKEIPRAVDERVAQLEEAASRNKVRMMIWVVGSFFALIPAVLFMGLRSGGSLAVLIAAILLNMALTIGFARQRRPIDIRNINASWIVFCLLLGVISRMFTPFMVAPGLAATSVMMFGLDARTPWRSCIAGHIAAVLGPWILELTGVLSVTTRAIGGDLLLRSDSVSITMPEAAISLAIYTVALIAIAGALTHQLAIAHRKAVRAIELQAWHLRQLVNS